MTTDNSNNLKWENQKKYKKQKSKEKLQIRTKNLKYYT